MKREFPNDWHRFITTLGYDDRPSELNLQLDRKMFPYLFGNTTLYIDRIAIFFETPDAEPSAHQIIELWVDEDGKPITDESRKCDVHTIHCAAREKLPGLFHGVLDIKLGPMSKKDQLDLGALGLRRKSMKFLKFLLFFLIWLNNLDSITTA